MTPKEPILRAWMFSDSAEVNLALITSFLKKTTSTTLSWVGPSCPNKQGNSGNLHALPPTSNLTSLEFRETNATSYQQSLMERREASTATGHSYRKLLRERMISSIQRHTNRALQKILGNCRTIKDCQQNHWHTAYLSGALDHLTGS